MRVDNVKFFKHFYPDNTPMHVLSERISQAYNDIPHTVPPTHVSIAYLNKGADIGIYTMNAYIYAKFITPKESQEFMIEHTNNTIAFIWHWMNDKGEPYHPNNLQTDYLPGISIWRNKAGKLHRVKYPAILFNKQVESYQPILYASLLEDFIKSIVDTTDVFKYPKIDKMRIEAFNIKPNPWTTKPFLSDFIKSFLNAFNWYAWDGNRIFISMLSDAAIRMRLDHPNKKKLLPITIEQLGLLLCSIEETYPLSDIKIHMYMLVKTYAEIMYFNPHDIMYGIFENYNREDILLKKVFDKQILNNDEVAFLQTL